MPLATIRHQSIKRYPEWMRTTVTLDPDVATAIERIRRRDGRRFKVVLNEVLRRGLAASPSEASKRPVTKSMDLGRAYMDVVSISAVLDELDSLQ
jgi:hypothetical protein